MSSPAHVAHCCFRRNSYRPPRHALMLSAPSSEGYPSSHCFHSDSCAVADGEPQCLIRSFDADATKFDRFVRRHWRCELDVWYRNRYRSIPNNLLNLSASSKTRSTGTVHTSAKTCLIVSRYGSGFQFWFGSPPKCYRLFNGPLPTFPENFMQIRLEVFPQTDRQTDRHTGRQTDKQWRLQSSAAEVIIEIFSTELLLNVVTDHSLVADHLFKFIYSAVQISTFLLVIHFVCTIIKSVWLLV